MAEQRDTQNIPRQSLPGAHHIGEVKQPNGVTYMAQGHKTLGTAGWTFFKGTDQSRASPDLGWKVHVSATTPAAQEALAALAMKHGIVEFKFAPDIDKFQMAGDLQAGKTAVFYHTERGLDGKRIDWAKFAQEADAIVNKMGGPGMVVQNDLPVKGSKAVFYRNELGVEHDVGHDGKPKYVANDDLAEYAKKHNIPKDRLHNLGNRPDPFEKITVSPSLQKEVRVKSPPVKVDLFKDMEKKKPRIFGNNTPEEPPPLPKDRPSPPPEIKKPRPRIFNVDETLIIKAQDNPFAPKKNLTPDKSGDTTITFTEQPPPQPSPAQAKAMLKQINSYPEIKWRMSSGKNDQGKVSIIAVDGLSPTRKAELGKALTALGIDYYTSQNNASVADDTIQIRSKDVSKVANIVGDKMNRIDTAEGLAVGQQKQPPPPPKTITEPGKPPPPPKAAVNPPGEPPPLQKPKPPPLPKPKLRPPRFNIDDGPFNGKRNLTGMDNRLIGSLNEWGERILPPDVERRVGKIYDKKLTPTAPDNGTPAANISEPDPKLASTGKTNTPPNASPEPEIINKTPPAKPSAGETVKSVLFKPSKPFSNQTSNRALGVASLAFGAKRTYDGIKNGDAEQAIVGTLQTGSGAMGLFSKSSKLVKGAGVVGIGVMTYDSAKQIFTADTTEKKIEAGVDTGIVLWSNIKTGGMAGNAGVTIKNEWKAYKSGEKSVSVGNVTKSVIYTGLDTTIGQLGKMGGAGIVTLFGGKGEDITAVMRETDAIYAREAKRFQAREDFGNIRPLTMHLGRGLDLTKDSGVRTFRKRLESKLDDAKERMQDNKHYMIFPSATRDGYNDAKNDVAYYKAALKEMDNGYVTEYRRIEKIKARNDKLREQRRAAVKEAFGDTLSAVASQQLGIDAANIEVEVLSKNVGYEYELDVLTLKIAGDKRKPEELVKELNKKLELDSPQTAEAVAYLHQHGLLDKDFNLKEIAFNVDMKENRENRVAISAKHMREIAMISQATKELTQQKQYANAILGNALGIDAKTVGFETTVKQKPGQKPSVVLTLKVHDEDALNKALQEKLGISGDDAQKLIDDPDALAATINDKMLLLNSAQTAKAVEFMKAPNSGIKVGNNFDVKKAGFSVTEDNQGNKVLAINGRRLTELDRIAQAAQKMTEPDKDKQVSLRQHDEHKDESKGMDKAKLQAQELVAKNTGVKHIKGEYNQNDIRLQPTSGTGKAPDERDLC